MYTLTTITPREALELPSARIVDTRSPREFDSDHLPGAINVPLFDDAQRAIIGTLFRREGFEKSFAAGGKMVEENLEKLMSRLSEVAGRDLPVDAARGLVDSISAMFRSGGGSEESTEIAEQPFRETETLVGRPVVVYCWRGGMRSKAVALLLGEIGVCCFQMSGGYKEYRRLVVKNFDTGRIPKCVVLRGNTGVGKTALLGRIEAAHPSSTIDLEGLAQHRSSILGDIGLKPRTKKMFDSLLYEEVFLKPRQKVLCEGESRKIGSVEIPLRFYEAVEAGPHVHVKASLETRCRLLAREYAETPGDLAAQFDERLAFLEGRLGKNVRTGIQSLFERGEYENVAEILITKYYDPLYANSNRGYEYALEVDSDDGESAAAAIYEYFQAL